MKTTKGIGKESRKFPRIDVFGVGIDDVGSKEAISAICEVAKLHGRGRYAVTVNSEFIMMAHRNREFARILAKSDLAVADGWWVAISKLISGGKEQDRIAGVDLIENVCKISAEKAIRVGFLGGFGGVAEEVARRQVEKYPGLKVAFAKPGEPTIRYDLRLKREIDAVGRIDILFVAYGMGKQEFWIDRNRQKLNIGLYIGVGGSFDYLAGVKKRAPVFMQNLGFEWLWRLVFDPARIWRQRIIPIFFLMILVKFWKVKILSKFFKNS